ncbi:MAG: hypothetical protein F4Z58_11235 [Acidimicrobiaceae bacterium]|nr:hypothetical protein [Acidimicrobiaceae bacterium]MYD08320.1 hypothetical protein [Acidimicrobiaceae bacterium]MYI58659.1 hypothetical protein [Acidimicrobiaceae bacterium]
MSFRDLLDECERDGIGSRFWTLFLGVAGRVARKYPPEVYNNSERWSEEAVRDLAQDVALRRLIDENQLEYVLSLATDEDSLSSLLSFQVRRMLSYRRATTVVDRLLFRILQLAEGPEFSVNGSGEARFITSADGGREPGGLRNSELHRGSLIIDSIPRLASRPSGERESKVYREKDLSELLRLLVDAFEGISLGDVRRILEMTLTAWLPTILHDHEEDHVDSSSPELELQRADMMITITGFVNDLSSAHRFVLLGKANGSSDEELAQQLGRSRPWLAERKREAMELVEERVISQVSSELHTEVTQVLLDELVELESQDE